MMKVNSLITDYINSLYGDNKSEHTTKNYLCDLKIYQKWIDANGFNITEVSLQDLNNYKVYLKNSKKPNGDNYSDKTIARRVTTLREFYSYLYKNNIIKENPVVNLAIPATKQDQAPEFLTEEEVGRLMNAIDGTTHELRDKAIISIFTTAGLRLSELVDLNITDIKGTLLKVRDGKGGKPRKMYLSDDCVEMINQYLQHRADKNNKALFLSQKGNRIARSTVQQMIDKYIEKADLDQEYSTHTLRHTAATLMLASGKVSLRTIQEILGHSTLTTTQKYTHVLDENLRDAANVMGNVLKKGRGRK